ncbi:hypothetical protein BDZ89DRAFT_552515 [Hymenopellis radicata]|nr:hypothetical protein BDZ89DRAFT_552515 [Hymenopellis radicata]
MMKVCSPIGKSSISISLSLLSLSPYFSFAFARCSSHFGSAAASAPLSRSLEPARDRCIVPRPWIRARRQLAFA